MKQHIKQFFIGLHILALHFYMSNLNAQSTALSSKGSIGFTYSGLGSNDAFYFESIDGGGDYSGKGYYSLGITYIHPITKYIDLGTGISYGKYKYQFSNASLGPDAPKPYRVNNTIIDIPVTVRLSVLGKNMA